MISITISFAIAIVIFILWFLFVIAVGWAADKYLEITPDRGAIELTLIMVLFTTLFVHLVLYS
jgi:hypothetical protein